MNKVFSWLFLNFTLPNSIFHQYTTQIKYFSFGILIYYLINSKMVRSTPPFILVISILVYVLFYLLELEESFILRPFLLSNILISIISLKHQLPRLGFDFSYGLYISHFPIIQMLLSFRMYSHSNLLVVASLIALIYSFMIWNLIEKPFLLYGKKFIK